MAGWDPVLLFVLACIAIIVIGPKKYVSLAGFGIMGAIAAVLLGGRGDSVIPMFALAGAGAVLLGVRTIGMLAGAWDQDDPAPVEHNPQQRAVDDANPVDRIWR